MTRFFSFLALLMLLAGLLSACGDAYTIPAGNGPIDQSTVSTLPDTPAQTATGAFQEYTLPQTNSGLMRPTMDAQGRVWFGEMGSNYLGMFDPQSRQFWQSKPPQGKYGIMGIVVAPDQSIWFAEQYANYIGHYMPTTGQYHIYPLPMVTQRGSSNSQATEQLPSGPNDLTLDARGYLWFSELNANAIGSLDTSTGALRQYPLPAPARGSGTELDPYGITVDPRGTVWFTEATNEKLGRLDPQSGQVTYFTPPGLVSPLMEVASNAQGQIWATTFTAGLLIFFDPASSHFTLYSIPQVDGNSMGSMYGLTIAASGNPWVTLTSEDRLAYLDVKQQTFVYYSIPTPGSLPLGLVAGKNQEIWFTESATNKIGMLKP
jgi:streptogramin lyase